MITKSSNATLAQSQDFKSYTFGIKESGLSHIFNVLRNQLYSDKVLAVIREYSCNAVDAHTEVGKKDVPIEVTLPNALMLELKVRDFGRGLTEKEIGEIYAMYGESTKRGTNEQIGQLGLGCKSAFAYGDNFVINSFTQGTKTSYNAFIDPSQVGRISKLSEESTDEENGIEIVIPVKREDCDEFYRKAVNLFAYFEVKPKVNGVDSAKFEEDSGKGGVLVEGDSWKVYRHGDPVAVMGNIAYPLDNYALDIHQSYGRNNSQDKDHLRYHLLDSSVLLKFDIGDLEISASREALQYTDFTKKNIIEKLDEVLKDIPSKVGQRFDNCNTLWEAKCFWQETFAYGGVGHSLSNIVSKSGVIWKGQKIGDGTFNFAKSDIKLSSHNGQADWDCQLLHFTKPNSYGKRKRVKGDFVNSILAHPNIAVVLDDRVSAHGRLNRIAPMMEEYESRNKDDKLYDSVYLLKFDSPSSQKDVLDKVKLDIDLISLNSLSSVKLRDIYPSNSTGKSNPTIKSTKHTTKEFVFDESHKGHAYDNCRSDWFVEDIVDIKEDEGIYLQVEKFFVLGKSCDEIHPHKIQKQIELLKELKIDIPPLYSFKKGKENKDGDDKWDILEGSDNWTSYWEWIEETMKNLLSDRSLAQKYIDRRVAKAFTERGHEIADSLNCCGGSDSILEAERRSKDINKEVHNEDSLFLKWYNKVDSMVNEKDGEKLDRLIYTIDQLNLDSDLVKSSRNGYSRDTVISYEKSKLCGRKPSHNLDELMQKVAERYPMIEYLDDYNFQYQWKESFANTFFNYINVVDTTYISNVKNNE